MTAEERIEALEQRVKALEAARDVQRAVDKIKDAMMHEMGMLAAAQASGQLFGRERVVAFVRFAVGTFLPALRSEMADDDTFERAVADGLTPADMLESMTSKVTEFAPLAKAARDAAVTWAEIGVST